MQQLELSNAHHTLPQQADRISMVLDHGFELYKQSWLRVAPYILLAGPPVLLTNNVLGKLSQTLALYFQGQGLKIASLPQIILVLLLASLAALGCYNAATYRIGMIGRGTDPGFIACLKQGFSDAPAALMVGIVFAILVAIATALGTMWMLLSVFAIWEYQHVIPESFRTFASIVFILIAMVPIFLLIAVTVIPWTMATCALVLRRDGIGTAIGAGYTLVTQHLWRSLLALSVPGVIYFIANSALMAFAAGLVTHLMVTNPVNSWAITNMIVGIVQIPILAVVVPLMQAATVAIFSDLIYRREGADLMQRVVRL